MTYSLIQGHESETRVDLLLQLTKITSEEIISAIKAHLCRGLTENDSAFMFDVKKQNLNRSLKTLNEVATIVEQIKEMDWKPANKSNQLSDQE